MIDLLINNNVVSGVLTIQDNSTNLSGLGITDGKITIKRLEFEKVLNGASTPTLANFLSSSLLTVTSKVDELVDVEYSLMKALTGATYANGQNTIDKTGIFNAARYFTHVLTNGVLYPIDWAASTANRLYTTKTFVNPVATIQLVLYRTECAVSLYAIPKMLKTLTLSQADCACKTCGDTITRITNAHRYIEGLDVSGDYDCGERAAFLLCLKQMFGLC